MVLSAAFAQTPPADGTQVAAAQTGNPDAAERVLVTARRREEDPQMVPLSLSVIDFETLDRTSTYNINQLTQLAPSLNYTSPNPRNTALTIRGLGSSVVAIAQANDGLEPGVGFYVDQVYHGRPATAAFDFVDLERVEILRGPQGTLFGKNTTAGAISITTRAPTFEREIIGEVTGGNLGFFQAKAALSGAIIDSRLAARVSAAFTKRNGVIENVTTGVDNNTVSNVAARGQLLYRPSEDFRVLAVDRLQRLRFQLLYAGVRPRRLRRSSPPRSNIHRSPPARTTRRRARIPSTGRPTSTRTSRSTPARAAFRPSPTGILVRSR